MQDKEIWCSKAVNPQYLAECRQYLKAEKNCDLPAEYIALLRYMNGACSEKAVLFGVLPEGHGMEDIVAANERYGLTPDRLALGETDLDILLYDFSDKDYKVCERQGNLPVEVFTDFEQAMNYWFS